MIPEAWRTGQAVWARALLVLTPLLLTLSALLERSGPIRLRHWAETASGRLRKLHESPARFVDM